MSRYDTGTDDTRVRVRAQKSSRPRTKRRPDYSDRQLGRVVGIDRGRFAVALQPTADLAATRVITAIKARELPRASVVIGDIVRLTGDLSGSEGSLGRISLVEPRRNVLRRSLEEAAEGRAEKTMVANADLMVIVVAAANPPPRVGMVDRALVAAREAGIPALIAMTKTDLSSAAPFLENFEGFGVEVVETATREGAVAGLKNVAEAVAGKFSILIGHSGVGKSTLINALVEDAGRAVGEVNQHTGKGRHTSTSAVALPLVGGGWIVDTPGVRSFGLGHVDVSDVLGVFPGVGEAAERCLPNCSHGGEEPDCAIDAWAPLGEAESVPRAARAIRARSLLAAIAES